MPDVSGVTPPCPRCADVAATHEKIRAVAAELDAAERGDLTDLGMNFNYGKAILGLLEPAEHTPPGVGWDWIEPSEHTHEETT